MRTFGIFICVFGMLINIFACYLNILEGDTAGAWLNTFCTIVCAFCFVACVRSDY